MTYRVHPTRETELRAPRTTVLLEMRRLTLAPVRDELTERRHAAYRAIIDDELRARHVLVFNLTAA